MRINSIYLAASVLFTLTAVRQSAAQSLAHQAFDLILEGDDPTQVFRFDLPFDPLVPSVVRFDGFFDNLDSSETGVRNKLWWLSVDGSKDEGLLDVEFTPLPAFGHLPVQIEQPIGFTPASVFFGVEGGGPGDHFHFVGELAIEQVPEPGAIALLGSAGVLGFLCRLFRRPNAGAA